MTRLRSSRASTKRGRRPALSGRAPGARPGAKPYSIVIPPPNVTGSLHIGHALNNTLQDILVRFERMRGHDVLWQPGTDHAGIATQMVVERQMMERQEPSRRDIGREKFVEKVWAWKAEFGRADHQPAEAPRLLLRLVARALHHGRGAVARRHQGVRRPSPEGLIYKDKRLVNWDPKLQTAISDLEVEQVETKGKLWHFRYPIEGEPGPRHRRRDDAAGDDARRHRRRGASGRRALQGPRRQVRHPAAGRPAAPDRRRRLCRSGDRLGRGQDHAGARLQRFRGRQAPRACRRSTSSTPRRTSCSPATRPSWRGVDRQRRAAARRSRRSTGWIASPRASASST